MLAECDVTGRMVGLNDMLEMFGFPGLGVGAAFLGAGKRAAKPEGFLTDEASNLGLFVGPDSCSRLLRLGDWDLLEATVELLRSVGAGPMRIRALVGLLRLGGGSRRPEG